MYDTLFGPRLTLEPVAVIRPVFQRLYRAIIVLIYTVYTTATRQRAVADIGRGPIVVLDPTCW